MKEHCTFQKINKEVPRITPSNVTELKQNEIFVFGSNKMGMHFGGAARFAYDNFGAEWGNGEGLQGKTYAIPTMEGIENAKQAVKRFISFATNNSDLIFLVTPVGCGIAGYSSEEIAPLFIDAAKLENIYLPEDFWSIILKQTHHNEKLS